MNRDLTPDPLDDTFSDLLTRLRPQSRLDEAWPAERHEATREQVLARIVDDAPRRRGARGAPTPGRGPRRAVHRPWFTLTAAVGAAAAVVVIAIGAPGVLDRPEHPRPAVTAGRPTPTVTAGTDASAATFLRNVALVAAEQPPDEHRDAPFWYTRTRSDQTPYVLADTWTDPAAGEHIVYETWEGRTSPGRIVGARWEAGGMTMDGPSTWHIGRTNLTWDQLDELPTDPVVLRQRFDAELAYYRTTPQGDFDQQVWNNVGDLLRGSPASPGLRRVLFEVLATVPGITVERGTTDAVGRPGVLVARVVASRSGAPRARYQMVIDPVTGKLLQERTEDIRKRGTSVYQATYLAQGAVGDDHATLPDD